MLRGLRMQGTDSAVQVRDSMQVKTLNVTLVVAAHDSEPGPHSADRVLLEGHAAHALLEALGEPQDA